MQTLKMKNFRFAIPAFLSLLIISCGALDTAQGLIGQGDESTGAATSGSNELWTDDFENPRSGWDEGDFDTGAVGYENGRYFVESKLKETQIWGIAGKSFDDLAVTVTTYTAAAPANLNNSFGIMCRVQSNNDAYLLEITSDGYFVIEYILEGNYNSLTDWTFSTLINQGIGAENEIMAVCSGSELSFHVNGELLAQVSDSTFARGDIALTATTYEDTPTRIQFDNLSVTRP